MGARLYRTIAETLEQEIADHPELWRLDPEIQLAQRFQVGVSTLTRALSELVERGLIERSPGRGTFVKGRQSHDAPDAEAHGLTRVVGVVLPGIQDQFAGNLLHGVLRELHRLGWQALVGFSDDRQEIESDAIKRMREQQVDGLMIFPAEGEAYNDEILRLKVDKFPFLLLDRQLPGIEAPSVSADHFEAARQAVAYLANLGHRRIAFVSLSSLFPLSTQSIVLRIEGFRDGMTGLVTSVDDLIWTRSLFHEGANDTLRRLADRLRQLQVSAVICDSIEDTCQVLNVQHQFKEGLPADFCVMGFDYGLTPTALVGSLWIDQHEFDIGRQAAQTMITVIHGEQAVESVKIPATIRTVGVSNAMVTS